MTTPIASFSGIASGVDTKSLVTQIIQVERAPAAAMETQEATLNSQKSAWTTYQGLVSALGTAAQALSTGTGFGAMTTTVTGTSTTGRPILSATAAIGAQAGVISVEVDALATSGTGNTAAQTDATSPIIAGGAATASFLVNGKTVTIDSTNNTLTGFRDAINAANANVTAYLLQTGTGTSLVIKANASGANGLTLSETTGTGTLAALGWTSQAGTDASLKIDGVPITRSSNTIADAVPGVTFALTTAEVGTTVQVQVNPDTTSAQTAVQAYVDAYNKIVDFNQSMVPVAGATTRPALASESSLSQNRATIMTAMQTTLGSNPSTLQSLSQAGISVGSDGKLTLNAATFASAYTSDRADLKLLFNDRMGAISNIADGISQGSTGTVALKITAITSSVSNLSDRVAAIDARLAIRQDSLTRQFAAMEAAVSRLQSQGTALANALGLTTSSK